MQKLFVKSSSIIVGKFTRIDYPTSIPPKLIGNLYHALPRQGGYTVRPKKITAPKYQHASNIPSVYEIDLPIIDLFIFQLRKDTIIMQDINFLIPNTPHNYPDIFKHDLGSKIFPYLSINVLMIWMQVYNLNVLWSIFYVITTEITCGVTRNPLTKK